MSEIRYLKGDATDPQMADDERALILHICNNAGTWGAGFVMALSRQWEEPEDTYFRLSEQCEQLSQRLPMGVVQFVPVTQRITVVNMIAQANYIEHEWPAETAHDLTKGPRRVDYGALGACLRQVAQFCKIQRYHFGTKYSVHMPRIGCGIGGGKWEEVQGAILIHLVDHHVPVTVYDYVPPGP